MCIGMPLQVLSMTWNDAGTPTVADLVEHESLQTSLDAHAQEKTGDPSISDAFELYSKPEILEPDNTWCA